MKKFTVLFILALGLFASCIPHPEENPDPIPPESSMFLKKIVEDQLNEPELITVFTYSGTKILRKENTNTEVTIYTYNDLDLITKIEEYKGGVLKKTNNFVYDISENLINLTIIDEATSLGTKWIYVHNANGTISYQRFTGDDVDQTNLVATGVISDAQIQETITDPVTAEETVNTQTFQFDLKNNPFVNVTGYDKIYFADSGLPLNNENNVISETNQIAGSSSEVLYTSEYEYTNNNFPSKMSVKESGVLVSTANFYYY